MKKRTAITLIVCLLVVIFWQVMAGLGRRPFEPFKLTGENFKGFIPVFEDYSVSPTLVRYSNTDPNIMAFEVKPVAGGQRAKMVLAESTESTEKKDDLAARPPGLDPRRLACATCASNVASPPTADGTHHSPSARIGGHTSSSSSSNPPLADTSRRSALTEAEGQTNHEQVVRDCLRGSSAGARAANNSSSPRHNSLIRLVHGYNMVDCMRLKGYTVEEVASGERAKMVLAEHAESTEKKDHSTADERRLTPIEERDVSQKHTTTHNNKDLPLFSSGNIHSENSSKTVLPAEPAAKTICVHRRSSAVNNSSLQIWRLTSETGNRSIWLTSMISYPNLEPTKVDTRDMQFPRVGDPADSRVPIKGITFESLKHPVKNFRTFIGAKWNNSRKDVLVFLGLKRPAWASDELLTLVTCSKGIDITPEQEQAVIEQLTELHFGFLGQLKEFKKN